jgi:tetrahydromethanopterin S-methyltransferase subunit E
MQTSERSGVLIGFVFVAVFVVVLICFRRATYVAHGTPLGVLDRADMTLAARR